MPPHLTDRLRAALLAVLCLTLAACQGQGSGPMPSVGVSPNGSASPVAATAAVYPGWNDQPVGGAEIVPILVSSDLAVGKNRFLLSLADGDNRLIASPEVSVALRFFELATNTERPDSERKALFLEVPGTDSGLYVANVDFRRPGDWGVQVEAALPGRAEDVKARVVFPVREESRTPAIGGVAPPSETPTATDREGIAAISTDEDPDPDFYRSSVADAVSSGKPSVITFATPKFCTSRVCGPTLDIVKAVAPPFKGSVQFVHVEVFSNLDKPDELTVVPAVTEWALPTEPWVFVVDGEGRIASKFEGVLAPEELEAAIEDVLRG